jgi:hypothetical protein
MIPISEMSDGRMTVLEAKILHVFEETIVYHLATLPLSP